ncbi:hypothetical protein DL93DRAFT_2217812, partial [Clavulina sp. PMI_390]
MIRVSICLMLSLPICNSMGLKEDTLSELPLSKMVSLSKLIAFWMRESLPHLLRLTCQLDFGLMLCLPSSMFSIAPLHLLCQANCLMRPGMEGNLL